jgi:TonB family protein
LYRIINERMVYPKAEKKKGIEGTVFVKFLVDDSGHTSNHTIYTSVNPALDAEALRIVQTIDGFVPARAGGQPVASEFVLQVQFKLPKDASASDKKKKSK